MSAEPNLDSGRKAGRDLPRSEFLDGARLCIPVVVASAPFAMLYGALAVSNGLSVFEAP